MPEPKGDGGAINATVEEFHCNGVPQSVWGDALGIEGGAFLRRHSDVLVQQIGEPIVAEWLSLEPR